MAPAPCILIDPAGVYAQIERGNGCAAETARVAIQPGAWHHLGLIAADRLTLYLDGREAAHAVARLDDLGGEIHIGQGADNSRGYRGEMDEVQISALARPAAWMQAAAAQGPDGRMLVYGEEESGDAAGGAYLAIMQVLAESVSPEEWFIIGLIALLGLLSLEAGVEKSLYLGRMERANAAFREQLAKLPMDAEMSGTTDAAFRDASLQRLHTLARREVLRILEMQEQRGLGRDLSPQGMEAVRASLDVGLVDEIERMNRKMVLLTLSVSGGPFLGLLGTVVGIMITFATIAASGDVNVNTIAPGVAAALTTTVAGLMIAIPAMFAYNQLAIRIRNLTAAMEVFADESIGRIALAHALRGGERKGEHHAQT